MFFGFILVFLIAGVCAFGQASEQTPDVIEIFIEGKRYKSIDKYKWDSAKSRIKAALSDIGDEDLDILIRGILKGLSKSEIKDIHKNELKQAIGELFLGDTKNQERIETDSEMVEEMEQMIQDYQQTRNEQEEINIDPDDVRTIIIRSPNQKE